MEEESSFELVHAVNYCGVYLPSSSVVSVPQAGLEDPLVVTAVTQQV